MLIPSDIEKIFILSPHLDDGVLDCSDHILEFKKRGIEVEMISFFTRFEASQLSVDAEAYLKASGMDNLQSFQATRENEDKQAMNELRIEFQHLSFIDGGFRENQSHHPIYATFVQLFSGNPSDSDSSLIKRIQETIASLNKRKHSLFLIPYGVGKHVDHKILRQVSELVLKPEQILYYLEFPYALDRRNWTGQLLFNLLFSKNRSVKNMSTVKKKLIGFYTSQIPILFKKASHYPEVIFRH